MLCMFSNGLFQLFSDSGLSNKFTKLACKKTKSLLHCMPVVTFFFQNVHVCNWLLTNFSFGTSSFSDYTMLMNIWWDKCCRHLIIGWQSFYLHTVSPQSCVDTSVLMLSVHVMLITIQRMLRHGFPLVSESSVMFVCHRFLSFTRNCADSLHCCIWICTAAVSSVVSKTQNTKYTYVCTETILISLFVSRCMALNNWRYSVQMIYSKQ